MQRTRMQENTPPSAARPKATTRVDGPNHGWGWERPNYNPQPNLKARREDHCALRSPRYPKTWKEAITCELFP